MSMASVNNKNLNNSESKFGDVKLVTFQNEAEVKQYQDQNSNLRLVIFQGIVYDVAEYLPQHPGGADLIVPYLGSCIDEPFEENEHTKSARNLFNDLPKVGLMKQIGGAGSDSDTQASDRGSHQNLKDNTKQIQGLDGYQLQGTWNPDYDKGLLLQLWTSKISLKEYVQFIEEPKHLINPVRDVILFNSPYLEVFSKTPWYAIPIAWSPFLVYWLSLNELDAFSSLFWFLAGIVNWTLIEYLIHRFIFHGEDYWLPESNFAYVAHFLLHGIHHAFPQDALRLVFPVLPGYIVMNFLLAPLVKSLTPDHLENIFVAGTLVGYILYDLIHYFIHHSSPKDGYWKNVKIYHMQHHYKNGKAGYGVSQKFWDIVFRTELRI